MNELYPIGDVARRTGLSVSAIRYYADAGIIAPSGHTGAGYRLYDVRAIASLELVRTLRDLGAGLDDIRRLLDGETSLHDLASAHLALVEARMRAFQARRAVLRTIVRQHSATEQVNLMHKLVSMSDDDRARLIEDFWTEVTDGLDLTDLVGELVRMRPRLPDDPTAEQLEAWIVLADTVRDAEFRAAVRDYFHDSFAVPDRDTAETWPEAEADRLTEILIEARAAARAGVPVDAPVARDLANRFLAVLAHLPGDPSADGEPDLDAVRLQVIASDPEPHAARGAALFDRYHALVATINGTPQPPAPGTGTPGSVWLHRAVAAL
ncbi:DNA-binding transcriptional MerR regulator [Catenuloplanes nepalensis]|uniref:DNA-binding transcriptional MerR regulator n=1 Tax=Catenuloplanes nepalensis TaxID=587533 RepID=A0ABT9MVI4_9ACTN|nr:MerR family transcriptional regulator [Catenuloplanes nepalensis]MDP9795461.1 DNA-binding transcriptional MerR regulator [Catenuloplanes nepalensis]